MPKSLLPYSITVLIVLFFIACAEDPLLSTKAQISTNKNEASLAITPEVTGSTMGVLSFALLSQASSGKAEIVANQLVYIPDNHFVGTDSFSYSVTDGNSTGIGLASVSVNDVSGLPLASTALINSRSGIASTAVTPFVLDPDFTETYTFSVSTNPSNGSAAIVNNKLVYTPSIVSGVDSFDYQVLDSQGNSIGGTAKVRIYENTAAGNTGLNRCRLISVVNPDGTFATRTNAGHCAAYAEVVSRKTDTDTNVSVQYVVHRPADGSAPKAAIMLIAGGTLRLNPKNNDASTGAITSTGGNFLVRTAQLLADGGYLVMVMNRPSDVADISPDVDQYRISVDHAIDVLAVNRRVNTDNLPLFIAGTSRGALSATALNPIATAVHLSSPVTSGALPSLWVGIPGYDKLQANYIRRPVRVSWHASDQCAVTTPANAQSLYDSLFALLGSQASRSSYRGGVEVTVDNGNVQPNDCGAFDYHGFMGIEPSVITAELDFFDKHLVNLTGTAPVAATARVFVQNEKDIDLSRFVQGNAVSFSLPYTSTSRGGSVSLSGSVVTYTAPAAGTSGVDYFVYVGTDSDGNIRAATVEISFIN